MVYMSVQNVFKFVELVFFGLNILTISYLILTIEMLNERAQLENSPPPPYQGIKSLLFTRTRTSHSISAAWNLNYTGILLPIENPYL